MKIKKDALWAFHAFRAPFTKSPCNLQIFDSFLKISFEKSTFFFWDFLIFHRFLVVLIVIDFFSWFYLYFLIGKPVEIHARFLREKGQVRENEQQQPQSE